MKAESKSIFEVVSQVMHITMDKIFSSSRKPDVVFARAIISNYLIARKFTTVQVGYLLNRDHSAIVHLIKVYNRNDVETSKYYKYIKEVIFLYKDTMQQDIKDKIHAHETQISKLKLELKKL